MAYYLQIHGYHFKHGDTMNDYSAEYNLTGRHEFFQTKKQTNRPFHICNESSVIQTVQSKGRILVMDDEECILNILHHALSAFGYTPFLSRNGDEAIELYLTAVKSGNPFDALILDLNIKKGMCGEEAISRILKISPEVKAIVSSAEYDRPAMRNYKDFGFKGILSKPYSLNKLKTELHKLLNEKN
jgi:CheY-like chemotaxis protein